MRIVKVVSDDKPAEGWFDAFNEWLAKKVAQAMNFDARYMKPYIDKIGRLYPELSMHVEIYGNKCWKGQDSEIISDTKKCYSFLDQAASECKKKFPNVKVNW